VPPWGELAGAIAGELLLDATSRDLYATDASPYERRPAGVVRPRHRADCRVVMRFARTHGVALVPRGAGTSLAGQCVGSGLIVDTAHSMRGILEIYPETRRARVEPGTVLADLNDALRPHGLTFPPDPSTATRCTLGGMVGNNAWGIHARRDGTTRDWIEGVECVLSDGSECRFGPLAEGERRAKLGMEALEGRIYAGLDRILCAHWEGIRAHAPAARGIPNNAGYALECLARQRPWSPHGLACNLAPLLCGSEGTLALITALTLRLAPLSGPRALICGHFSDLVQAVHAVGLAIALGAGAVELLDRKLLALTSANPLQARNRLWVEGQPEAVLLIEVEDQDGAGLEHRAQALVEGLRAQGHGYAWPLLCGPAAERAWDLRRAGLGLLMGMPGPRKAVTGMEDSAVAVADLPAYLSDLLALVRRHGTECAVYGPVSMGTLHLRPLLDFGSASDRAAYEAILEGMAILVRRYGGSLSAKHGDGRLRAAYLDASLGPELVSLVREVKQLFDPRGLLNPGKILDPPALLADLRAGYRSGTSPSTVFNWAASDGVLGMASRCHGAGVCLQGPGRGTMCPSYMALREERHGTRGRAQLLRQALLAPDPAGALAADALWEALDLCLGCKGCRAECPANVDLARLKAEVLQHRHDDLGTPLRARLLGRLGAWNAIASRMPHLANALADLSLVKRWLGIHPGRALPRIAPERFSRRFQHETVAKAPGPRGDLVFLNDVFTEYYQPELGRIAVRLFARLGYRVHLSRTCSVGRVEISQGLLRRARASLEAALAEIYPYAKSGLQIVGVEPSEVLTLRDEAVDLVSAPLRSQVQAVAAQALTFEEFLLRESQGGALDGLRFDGAPRRVLAHLHCHQKAIMGIEPTLEALGAIPGLSVRAIPSGCCGMAGAFGYEAAHYDLSRRIAELVLLPALQAAPPEDLVVATGASCRQQIKDLSGRTALHPVEVVHMALV
jgi:FAD/FMN-containing dehydrogenase/Fe-S oxidoreductase